MSIMHEWAAKHGISNSALIDLRDMLGGHGGVLTPGVSEAGIQSQVRLEASRKGGRLWRNNIGAMFDEAGNFVRFGLANESKGMNELLKSADLIGCMPKLITSAHVGSVIGVYTSRECKPGSWRFSGTEHEIAQMNWAQLICSLGGDAKFCNSEGSL